MSDQKLKDLVRGLLVDTVRGDDALQAVQEDYPDATLEELIQLRNEVMRLAQEAQVHVSWPDD